MLIYRRIRHLSGNIIWRLVLVISRRVFLFIPLRLSFFFLVFIEITRSRGRTLFASAFKRVLIRRLRKNSDIRLSSRLTARFPLRTAAVLSRLGLNQEITELLTAEGLVLKSTDASVILAWALFEIGEFKRALDVLSAWSITSITGHSVMMEVRGLMTLIAGNEKDSSLFLEQSAKGMGHLFSPHQNIAARYSSNYIPNKIDIISGEAGRLYDFYNFTGQRVTHVGEGQLSTDLYAGALHAQKRLRQDFPKPSRALRKLLDHLGFIDIKCLRIFPTEWFTQVGHQGMIDIMLRMRDLGWWKGDILFLVPTDKVANHAFLSLYEKQGVMLPWHNKADHDVMAELFSLQRYCGYSFNAFEMPNGDILPWQEAGALAIRQWEAESRPSPLKNEFDRQFNCLSIIIDSVEQTKKKWGMRPDDWYVCLHMRDASYYREIDGAGQTHRNASVKNYLKAIEYITNQGGWVIKMGGPDSPKIPKMARVIDYGRSKFKSEIMDIYLIRHARFFIGTTSGLTNVAVSFDTPCALVNCITTDAQLWGSKVRFALKTIYLRDGSSLSQRQLTSTPWRWRLFSAEVMTRHGAVAYENPEDELLETVKEVDCIANNKIYNSPLKGPAKEIIDHWRRNLEIISFYGNGLPGLYFLQKNASYLIDDKII